MPSPPSSAECQVDLHPPEAARSGHGAYYVAEHAEDVAGHAGVGRAGAGHGAAADGEDAAASPPSRRSD